MISRRNATRTVLVMWFVTACAGAPPPAARDRALQPAPDARIAAADAAPRRFDPAPWLEDLHALIAELTSHYANLDHARLDRRMDLPALVRLTEARLRAAPSEQEAKRTLEAFLKAFGDAHMTIEWATPGAEGIVDPKAPLCARLGYAGQEASGVDFGQLPDFTPDTDADADAVPGGILRLDHGDKLGVLRIALFEPFIHPLLCEAAITALGLGNDAPCDDACGDRVELAASNLLTAALERRARSLAARGARAIAVDITRNGGGTDWVEPATRVLTATRIEASPSGLVRHEHSLASLRERLAAVEADLAAHGDLPGGILARALPRMRAELAEVATPCDQSAIWTDAHAAPTCTQVVKIAPLVTYARPGELAGRVIAELLFKPSRFEYHEGSNTLPLIVLVDGRTGSAAEGMAETLQDQGAAVIMGAVTAGAGCGFTNGGIPTTLPHSRARVHMPDCARFRKDGSNAVAGVTPDVVLPLLDRDSPYERAVKIAAGLRASWPKIVTKPRPHS